MSHKNFNPKQYRNLIQSQENEEDDWLDEDEDFRKPQKHKNRKFKENKAQ